MRRYQRPIAIHASPQLQQNNALHFREACLARAMRVCKCQTLFGCALESIGSVNLKISKGSGFVACKVLLQLCINLKESSHKFEVFVIILREDRRKGEGGGGRETASKA